MENSSSLILQVSLYLLFVNKKNKHCIFVAVLIVFEIFYVWVLQHSFIFTAASRLTCFGFWWAQQESGLEFESRMRRGAVRGGLGLDRSLQVTCDDGTMAYHLILHIIPDGLFAAYCPLSFPSWDLWVTPSASLFSHSGINYIIIQSLIINLIHFSRFRSMKNLFNHLLSCLCIADIVFLTSNILVLPFHFGLKVNLF